MASTLRWEWLLCLVPAWPYPMAACARSLRTLRCLRKPSARRAVTWLAQAFVRHIGSTVVSKVQACPRAPVLTVVGGSMHSETSCRHVSQRAGGC